MASDDRFDLDVARWLESEGRVMAPNWLHDAAMATALHTRQRPLARKLRGMSVRGGRAGARHGRRAAEPRGGLGLARRRLGDRRVATPALLSIQNGQVLVARVTTPPVAQYFTMDADGTDGA